MVGTRSYTVAARGANNRTKGKAIKDPIDALRESGVETGEVDPGIQISNAACARSIKRFDILEISSRRPDRSNRVGNSSGLQIPLGSHILPEA